MKMQEAIIAASKKLASSVTSTNGYAFIYEPRDGDVNNWKWAAEENAACYAGLRREGVKIGYADNFHVSDKTHFPRFFIDMFNRKGAQQQLEENKNCWKYLIQRSPFKPVFIKETFKKQLEYGVMFDLKRHNWEAIISAAIALRHTHEYQGGKAFTEAKKAGMTEIQSWILSWFCRFTADNKSLTMEARSGHSIVNSASVTTDTVAHFLKGNFIPLDGNSTHVRRDSYSSQYLNPKRNGGAFFPRLVHHPDALVQGDVWNLRKTLPVSSFKKLIKQLVKA